MSPPTRFLDQPGETQEILDQAAKSRKPIHQDQALTLVIELYLDVPGS